LIAGYAGLLSIAQAGFYGIGAYGTAILGSSLCLPFYIYFPITLIIACLISLLVIAPSLRVHDDYFVLLTFGLQVILFNVEVNWIHLTNGPMGISGINRPEIFGIVINNNILFLIIVFSIAFLISRFSFVIIKSPIGRILKCIREDEVLCEANGKNIFSNKTLIFLTSSILSSIAGIIYALYISYIDPTSFTIQESIFILSIVIIGGAGNLRGPLLGTLLLVSLPEILRFLKLPESFAANIRQILYCSLLIIFMIWRPKGLVGDYSFEKSTK
jgi:branched-chain amino acid transport system permease protein